MKVHLAGMEARDAWHRLEPALADAAELAKQATTASTAALKALAAEAARLRDQITR